MLSQSLLQITQRRRREDGRILVVIGKDRDPEGSNRTVTSTVFCSAAANAAVSSPGSLRASISLLNIVVS